MLQMILESYVINTMTWGPLGNVLMLANQVSAVFMVRVLEFHFKITLKPFTLTILQMHHQKQMLLVRIAIRISIVHNTLTVT
jgi:hypothetical protein